MNDMDRGGAATAVPPDPSVALRRMHYTFTGLHVAVVVILQLLLFFRTVHMGFVLFVSTGFAFVVAGVFVGIMASNIDHLAVFSIGSAQSRVIVWTNVAAIVFMLLNILQVFYLLGLPPLTAGVVGRIASPWLAVPDTAVDAGEGGERATQQSPARPVTLGMSVDDMETLLSHHIHEADRLLLVLMLVLFGIIGLLHLISLVVYARIALGTATAQTSSGNTPWKQVMHSPFIYSTQGTSAIHETLSRTAAMAASGNNNNNNSAPGNNSTDHASINPYPIAASDLETGGNVTSTGRRTPTLQQSQPRYNKAAVYSIGSGSTGNQ
jgi:hypothetical protein